MLEYFPEDNNSNSTKLTNQPLGNVKYHVGYLEPESVNNELPAPTGIQPSQQQPAF